MNIAELILLTTEAQSTGLTNPIKAQSVGEFIGILLDGVVAFAIPILTLVFVWIGFMFITSTGNPGKLNEVKQWALFAVIGALIIVAARGIYAFVQGTISNVTETATNLHQQERPPIV